MRDASILRKIRAQKAWLALLVLMSFLGQACSDTVQGGIIVPADAHGDVKYKFDTKNPVDTGDEADADPNVDVVGADVGCKRVIIPQVDTTTTQRAVRRRKSPFLGKLSRTTAFPVPVRARWATRFQRPIQRAARRTTRSTRTKVRRRTIR